ncbi:MAG: hypothetical protein EHM81_10535 [Chloroflexi bacterium]|nr:MAG: hypothetical protein EHM81_10535 [Chloroflexota bacterium]
MTLLCLFGLLVAMIFWGRTPLVLVEKAIAPLENPAVDPRQARVGLFLLIASACGLVIVIANSQVKQQWPGWDLVLTWVAYMLGWALRAIPLNSIWEYWKKDGEYLVSLLLMHLSVIAVLSAYYDTTQVFYFTLVLLVLAAINLRRFWQRVPVIFWLVTLILVFYTININAWSNSVIGDDYNFHELAWQFAERMSFLQVGELLFKASGAHGTHPFFSSFVQSISIKFLGHDSFGWRFSSLYLCALGVGLFYYFCKTFLSERASLLAAFLLAVSHYVMSFGKIGYNNLQALFALSLALAVAAWTLRSKTPLAFAVLGSVFAFCFYLYPASLYVIPIPVLLLLLYYPPITRKAAGHWLVMIAVWVAMVYPLMMQDSYWRTKVDGTIFNRPDLVQSFDVVARHFAQNLFYSFFSYLYIIESHYVAVSHVDPLTAIFVSIGFFVLLYQFRRQRFAVFTALGFVFYLFVVGSSHDRDAPPNTRMFLMLPWFSLFGAWGILWVEGKARKIGSLQIDSKDILVPLILVAIAGANLYQAYHISYVRYSGFQSPETLFLRVTKSVYDVEPHVTKNYVVIVGDLWGITGLVEFQNVYPYLAWFHISQITITEPVLPETSLPLLAERNTLVMLSPWLDPAWQETLGTTLEALGKRHCNVITPAGDFRFSLYHAPELPQACPAP